MEEILETAVDGVKIKLGKVVLDDRGFLAELSPTGIDHTFFNAGIKNIYVSTSTQKNIIRAGHLHYKNVENFYTLSGTALWIFVDLRRDSPTYNKAFAVILGSKTPSFETNDPIYTIDMSTSAQVLVPTGVYHAYLQLTDEPVTVLAIASEPYDEKDYDRTPPTSIPQIQEKLKEYDIVI